MEELTPTNSVPQLDGSVQIHQLQEPVPIDLQGEFFGHVRQRREEIEKKERLFPTEAELIHRIREVLDEEPRLPDDKLMLYFASLACCKSIEALRFAESLIKERSGYERYLALMAELEVRMHVHEDLTGEPQAIIASGLGGQGELIRLNGVAFHRDFKPWEPYQRDLLHQAMAEMCEEYGGYIEQEDWGEEYYNFLLLLPYYANIAEGIESVMNECNQYGQFIYPDCHVGNMHLLTDEMIQQIMYYRKKGQSDEPAFQSKSIQDFLDTLGDTSMPEGDEEE